MELDEMPANLISRASDRVSTLAALIVNKVQLFVNAGFYSLCIVFID